jgi:hypothetical protein
MAGMILDLAIEPSRVASIPASFPVEWHEKEELQMSRQSTKTPLRVSSDGTAGPYVMVPVSELEGIKKLLNEHKVGYWVDENAISLNGEPEVSVINLGQGADAQRIQRLLNGTP